MVTLQSIVSGLEPTKGREQVERSKKDVVAAGTTLAAKENVQISDEAKRAADAARLVELAKEHSEIRQERVAEARQNIEEGTYKLGQIVLQVAGHVSHAL